MMPIVAPTGYEEKLLLLAKEIVNHGWGSYILDVESLKDNTVKIQISCGKSYVFFIKKDILIDESKLL